MKEYAFDLTLSACVRVMATSESAARALVVEHFDCLDLSPLVFHPNVKLTEANLCHEIKSGDLFEIDGEPV